MLYLHFHLISIIVAVIVIIGAEDETSLVYSRQDSATDPQAKPSPMLFLPPIIQETQKYGVFLSLSW